MIGISSPTEQVLEAPRFGDDRLPERFWVKVTVTEQGCWQWTAVASKGYGRFCVGANSRPRMARAHRHAYAVLVGPIDEGVTLDHACHSRDMDCPGGMACLHRRCVNPAHMEPMTNTENQRRSPNTLASRSAAKTHCPQGHPYDVENTVVFESEGKRRCRTCLRTRRAVKTPALATP